jgi:hypothetical protein
MPRGKFSGLVFCHREPEFDEISWWLPFCVIVYDTLWLRWSVCSRLGEWRRLR